nr:putative autophagy-related protein 11 [Plodia interpunctella]
MTDGKRKKKRKKDTCCYKYGPKAWIRKLNNCIYRRLKRRLKRKVFGISELGFTSDTKKSKKKSSTEKSGILNKYALRNTSFASASELTSKSKDYFNQKYNERELDINNLDKIKNLYDNMRKKSINLDNYKNIDADELKRKFSLSGSKAKVYNKLFEKKGKISLTELTQTKVYEKTKKSKNNVINIDNFKNMDKDELKRKLSLSGSEAKVFNKMVDDYRKGKISLTDLTQSKNEPKKLNKEKVDEMLKLYDEKKKTKNNAVSLDNLKYMDKDELRRKLSLSGSKANAFNKMVDDYRKGKISLTKLTQSKTEPKKLNKQKIDEMLTVYDNTKKRKSNVVNLDNLKNMDKDELKKKLSLSGSKANVFNKMVDDYRKGKLSLTKLTQSKTEPKKFSKQKMDEMLLAYEKTKNSKTNKLSSKLDVFKPYYSDVKDNLKELKDKVTRSKMKQ